MFLCCCYFCHVYCFMLLLYCMLYFAFHNVKCHSLISAMSFMICVTNGLNLMTKFSHKNKEHRLISEIKCECDLEEKEELVNLVINLSDVSAKNKHFLVISKAVACLFTPATLKKAQKWSLAIPMSRVHLGFIYRLLEITRSIAQQCVVRAQKLIMCQKICWEMWQKSAVVCDIINMNIEITSNKD